MNEKFLKNKEEEEKEYKLNYKFYVINNSYYKSFIHSYL